MAIVFKTDSDNDTPPVDITLIRNTDEVEIYADNELIAAFQSDGILRLYVFHNPKDTPFQTDLKGYLKVERN